MKSFSLSISILMLMLTACEKTALLRYQSSNDIYFNYQVSSVQRDSMNMQFAVVKDVADTFSIPVKVLGKAADVPRSFTLRVNQSLTTAEAGKHYALTPADSHFIPAKVIDGAFTIILKRPADLYEKKVDLVLDLLPDENFTTNMKVFDYTALRPLKATQWKVTIEDILYEPTNWTFSAAYLGTYSREKLTLMASTQNLTLNLFYAAPLYSATQQNNFAITMQKYLNAQKALGNTVYERDGTEMVMGASAQ
ncbi:DUF4843 domain-containing protein [uncultured Chitinophaga sp.]|uniref:DUF4843 domain-containing protein n=1 Tax=uncultured Chitinophaga sp. TaxID=339340 RepID=UPI0025E7F518|nr:DUF4843 domain-containing protein [uncultured Chitinophaga sp.]